MVRRRVSIFINGKEVANEIKTIASEKRKLNAELRKATIGTKKYESKVKELRRVNRIIDHHNSRIRDVRTAWEKLARGGVTKIAGIAAGAFAVDAIVGYGRELFKLGTQMELLERKAATVFKQALPGVTRAAQENAAAMGLTTAKYVDAAAKIGDLLIPMEFFPQEAADMSTSLVDLSGALAEWTGGQIDAENVARILSKAVLGEREELKQLGISILETDVKGRLAEKGLKNLTGTMLQQAKATATLELITEKSADAQAAFAANSDLSARKQAELSARISDISEKLATALIPIFSKLVDVAASAVHVIDGVVDVFSRMSDPAKAAVKAFDEQTASVNDLERNLVPLLNKYDELTNKTELTEEEQIELAKVIAEVGNITPTAITEIDNYGNALSINASKSREFLAAEKSRLEFVNKDAIAALESQIESLVSQRKLLDKAITTGRGGLLNIEYSPETINQFRGDVASLTRDIQGATAELTRLTGGGLDQPQPPTATTLSPTPEERAAQEEAGEKLRKQREDQAKRTLKDRQRQLEQLADALQDHEDEQSLARLSDEERTLEQIRRRYQKEIDIAVALEAQGVTKATEAKKQLIALRDQEILKQTLEQNQAAFEAEMQQKEEHETERLQREQAFKTSRDQANREIQEITRQTVLSEQQLALIELEEYYRDVIALAEQHGIDIFDIEIVRDRELKKLRKEFSDKAIKETAAEQQAIAENYAETYSNISSLIGSAIQLASDQSKEATALQKVLTLAQIGFSSAAAIAAATAEGAKAGPFPANLAAIATGVAVVVGNIAQARSLFAETPQFFMGGYTKAKGASDGRTYNARYVGAPATGMLPNSPVLMDTSIGRVLASERGREYFVNNTALKNPYVFNHVQAIENIVKYKQYAEGGFTTTATATPTTGGDSIDMTQLTEATGALTVAIGLLVERLNDPIYALIDDDEAIALRNRINQLIDASGGVL